MSSKVLILTIAILLLNSVSIAFADHEGPERIVDGKYTIILSIIPKDNNALDLRFYFNDSETGKIVSDLMPTISINDDKGSTVLSGQQITLKDGVASFLYTFPSSGLFSVMLNFYKGGVADKVYRPEAWSVWVPGKEGTSGAGYPIGLSEILSFGLAGTAVALVIWSLMANKKSK